MWVMRMHIFAHGIFYVKKLIAADVLINTHEAKHRVPGRIDISRMGIADSLPDGIKTALPDIN